MANALNWFEIPTADLERANTFYGTIFNTSLIPMDMPEIKMRMFPVEPGQGVGGAIVHHEMLKPSADGTMVYLNGGNDLQEVLSRVEPAGGQIAVPKTHINDEIGYFAIFIDTEGNKVALHSQN